MVHNTCRVFAREGGGVNLPNACFILAVIEYLSFFF